MKKFKKSLLLVLSFALVAVVSVTSTLAYLSAQDNEASVFTAGQVDVELIEQQRNADRTALEDFKQGKELLPLVGSAQGAKDKFGLPKAANFVDKIITVENTGKNDAWVRVLVGFPTALDAATADKMPLHWNVGNYFHADGTYTDEGTVGDARDISTNGSWSSNGDKGDRYSDTPQGTIANTDVTGNAYLTNVRLINENASGTTGETTFDNNLQTKNLLGTNTSAESYSDDTDSTRNENNVYEETNAVDSSSTGNVTNNVNESMINSDQYLDHIVGKMSTMPYSDLLQKYRETFLNIDMEVIVDSKHYLFEDHEN